MNIPKLFSHTTLVLTFMLVRIYMAPVHGDIPPLFTAPP